MTDDDDDVALYCALLVHLELNVSRSLSTRQTQTPEMESELIKAS